MKQVSFFKKQKFPQKTTSEKKSISPKTFCVCVLLTMYCSKSRQWEYQYPHTVSFESFLSYTYMKIYKDMLKHFHLIPLQNSQKKLLLIILYYLISVFLKNSEILSLFTLLSSGQFSICLLKKIIMNENMLIDKIKLQSQGQRNKPLKEF